MMGRPSKFNEQIHEKILKLAEQGKTVDQIADVIGVAARTIYNWQGSNPELFQSIKEAKQVADDLVEASLFSRAVGYSHLEEKVFCSDGQITTHVVTKHYPPETAACMAWLYNRRPEDWRQRPATPSLEDIPTDELIAEAKRRLNAVAGGS